MLDFTGSLGFDMSLRDYSSLIRTDRFSVGKLVPVIAMTNSN